MSENNINDLEQIAMSDFAPDGQAEKDYINLIYPQIVSTVEKCGGDASLLSVAAVKPGYKFSRDYVSLKLGSMVVFRIKLHGKAQYLAFPDIFAELIPDSFPKKAAASQPKYVRLTVDNDFPIEKYTDLILKLMVEAMNRYPSEWSCCSRYQECSDAKACINPDKNIALACSYRKTLNSGRIFYGKNRNI